MEASLIVIQKKDCADTFYDPRFVIFLTDSTSSSQGRPPVENHCDYGFYL